MRIAVDDLSSPAAAALLEHHLRDMRGHSPAGRAFALDAAGLTAPGVTVWAAWEGEDLLGIAALNRLDARVGEVKSMRTHPDHLRRGVAAALLEVVIAAARAEGLTRLSLETGSGPRFEPALALYVKRGFRRGKPFAAYEASDFNQFLHLDLD